MNNILIIASAVIFLLLGGFIFFANRFYKIGVARKPESFKASSEKDGVFLKNGVKGSDDRTWWQAQPFTAVQVTSQDGLALNGYLLPSNTGSLKTVILFHGYRCSAAGMAEYARFYHDDFDCNVLIPDARGHGKSQGKSIGMGWTERVDIPVWVREIENRFGTEAKIALTGVSMGGATVMMAAGVRLPASVKCIIEDCGFDTVFNEFKCQLKESYHLPAFPMLYAASLVSKIRAGYSFKEASCLGQLAKAGVPVMFIHGAEDDVVPLEMGQACYQACTSPKQLWVVPGAGHGLAYQAHPDEYKQRVGQWLALYLK